MYCSPVFQAQNSPKKPKILAGVLTIAILALRHLRNGCAEPFFLEKKSSFFGIFSPSETRLEKNLSFLCENFRHLI